MADDYQYAQPGVYAPVAPAPVTAPAAVGGTPQAKPKKTTGYVVAIVILSILLVFALGFAGCTAFTASLDMFSSFGSLGGRGYAITGPTVAVIDIDSTIEHGGGNCSPEGLAALLEEAEANDNIKAIVLHVNSGGGASTAGEEMSILIARCTKPVVVSSASTNASAAYEISSQADYIFRTEFQVY